MEREVSPLLGESGCAVDTRRGVGGDVVADEEVMDFARCHHGAHRAQAVQRAARRRIQADRRMQEEAAVREADDGHARADVTDGQLEWAVGDPEI